MHNLFSNNLFLRANHFSLMYSLTLGLGFDIAILGFLRLGVLRLTRNINNKYLLQGEVLQKVRPRLCELRFL